MNFSDFLSRKGTYILLVELFEEQNILVGKLGSLLFKKGFYAYVGSAMGGFKTRIGRHLRKDKFFHWHIDFLLQRAEIREIILCESEKETECLFAQLLSQKFHSVPNFGSSDCKCKSHLFFSEKRDVLEGGILNAVSQLGLQAEVLTINDEDY